MAEGSPEANDHWTPGPRDIGSMRIRQRLATQDLAGPAGSHDPDGARDPIRSLDQHDRTPRACATSDGYPPVHRKGDGPWATLPMIQTRRG